MIKSPIRTDEYRAQAAAAAERGAAAALDHVRQKHERAAQVWTDLALAEEARGAQRAERLAQAALRA